MPTDRVEDVALTEAAFRIANERMARWEERHGSRAEELYMCECASRPCRERIPLTREQYEDVRSDVRHFLVVPGLVLPEPRLQLAHGTARELLELLGDIPRHHGPAVPQDFPQRAFCFCFLGEEHLRIAGIILDRKLEGCDYIVS